MMDAGKATGVIATITPPDGGEAWALTVRAKAVVVAGGALHTPAILLRSGLKHPLLGRHLCLHPVMAVAGVFPEDYKNNSRAGEETTSSAGDMDSSSGGNSFGRGVMMGVYVDDHMGVGGQGYGVVVQTPPIHPGLLGMTTPWNDALTFRLSVAMETETACFIGIARDRSNEDNRVVLGPRGDPIIRQDGITPRWKLSLRLLRAAGASLLVPVHTGTRWFCAEDRDEGDSDFEDYIKETEMAGTRVNQAGLFSAHQMGTCRMGATEADGPVRETGETWECEGLYVADASTLPTSLGINPMITIEAIAYVVAEEVAKKLLPYKGVGARMPNNSAHSTSEVSGDQCEGSARVYTATFDGKKRRGWGGTMGKDREAGPDNDDFGVDPDSLIW
ncbi:unnamed protein product [Choristocarpus tenellus]